MINLCGITRQSTSINVIALKHHFAMNLVALLLRHFFCDQTIKINKINQCGMAASFALQKHSHLATNRQGGGRRSTWWLCAFAVAMQ